ncbi:hypothetical protein [Deminuibacter soli]|uniref:Uncharacterized protein n=1 Tax=Deminuibacter soli TaxID=2291815 RepID=A0A3E1NLS6_9BACT|nr:hypothetical protein [Deminuibacter soli]RFM28885.1 hypothetical protein DXN05_08945 [Deminuibacter soli]
MPVPAIVILLLEKIHNFYPIGAPHYANNYPGYERISDLTAKKIKEQIEHIEGAWEHLFAEVNNLHRSYELIDRAYYQFPCYILNLTLSSLNQNGVTTTTTLVLNISLLVDYFTIYIEDDHIYTKYNSPSRPHHTFFLFNKSTDSLQIKQIISDVHDIVIRHFPNHTFVPHNILFNYQVTGGIPFKEEYDADRKSYSIYEYLFLPNPYHYPFVVLE